MAFLQNLIRNHHEAWWEKLFRFSPEEFFKRLVPVLDLPDTFTVDGCVLGSLALLGWRIDNIDVLTVRHGAVCPSTDQLNCSAAMSVRRLV